MPKEFANYGLARAPVLERIPSRFSALRGSVLDFVKDNYFVST